jgi:hypothetical protein
VAWSTPWLTTLRGMAMEVDQPLNEERLKAR